MKTVLGGVILAVVAATAAPAQEFLREPSDAEVRARAAWVAARAVQGEREEEVAAQAVVETVQAAGVWGEGVGTTATRTWSATALRSKDDQLRGRVTLTGVPLVDGANLEGRVSGRGVVGRLLDDEGRTLAEFDGVVLPGGGARGTYRARGGGMGEWQWPGDGK